ncbi:diphthine--ammonia ligase [archaeon]|jgi:diphthine-ammonia ligase|nr:diphthine--ammonia ligase [archaeon]
MKCAVLFSGGKDSVYAGYVAKKEGHELSCLISIFSKNEESYMFHTPSIEKVKSQAEVMNIPLMIQETKGKKEEELEDLELAIKNAIEKYGIECIITGAIQSVYQASRIQKICDKLKIKCLNPLWQKDETEYLSELIENKFKVIITAVAAYPLDKSWLGREINEKYLDDVKVLHEKYKIHVAGEGGEFETFVLDCPLFERPLKVKDKKISGEDNAWRMEIELE